MYDWLDRAVGDSSQVITGSRRLARVLRAEHAAQQFAAGKTVWPSPAILSWQDWLAELVASSNDQAELPTAITSHQSRILWERCLSREINDPLLNVAMLARQSREAWNRLQEWQVPLGECQRQARNRDQRLFAKVASNYESILEREGWVDESGIANLAIGLLNAASVTTPSRLTLAGFDRVSPQLEAVLEKIRAAGGVVDVAALDAQESQISIYSPENGDAELRAAGAWARKQLQQYPDSRLTIVVTHLEQDAQRSLRLIKEGLLPGWQNASAQQNAAINISYGRKLADYPAIAIAILALRWLHNDLSTREISRLLLSPMLWPEAGDERTRVELRLRQLPEQSWSPQRLLAEVSAWEGGGPATDGLGLVRKTAEHREQLPQRQSPAEWVSLFSDVLQDLGWPGAETLASAEFQLVNRWRELYNDVARLELVAPSMTSSEALGRMTTIASEVIYQPEADGSMLQVMGPLEAAGMHFDKLWMTGLSSSNWPPAGKPLTLVSRDLQRETGMPDATPADTLEYAQRVIGRLATSASQAVFSFPQTQNDAQQSASELLRDLNPAELLDGSDPGWNAMRLCARTSLLSDIADPVPPVAENEFITGGAATIQRQLVEPFGAFVAGRLAVRTIWPIVAGLPAGIRGSLIHGALHRLYEDCPSSDQIRGWDTAEIETRTDQAVQTEFRSHERHADVALQQLLRLEKHRVKGLLRGVIAQDARREQFCIESVEEKLELDIGGISMRLRLDRVDLEKDELLVLDYKTGVAKRLLDRGKNPKDMQLIVYACALQDPVGGVGLLNIDPRSIELDGAGRYLTPKLDWDSCLAEWKEQVVHAAQEIAAGDVRINGSQTTQAARPFGLLSRNRELLHER